MFLLRHLRKGLRHMKRVTKLRKTFRRDWQLYVFMLIPLIWVIIFLLRAYVRGADCVP